MTDTVAGQSQDQSDQQTPAGGRYRSTRGLDYDSVPWKLWEKSKKLFWDPADLDFSQDADRLAGDDRTRSGRWSPCRPAGSWSARKP